MVCSVDLPRSGAPRRPARAARPLGRRGRAAHRGARRDPRRGLEGLGARLRGRASDLAPARDRERLGGGRAARLAPARRRLCERARSRGRPVPGPADRMTAIVDTLRLTAEEAIGLVERGDVSAPELHAAYLEAIGERDGELHAYLRTVEKADGSSIPIALKDVISTKGVETTAGS